MVYLLAATAVAAAGFVFLRRHLRRRTQLYRALAGQRQAVIAGRAPCITAATAPASLRAEFERERIVQIHGFLSSQSLSRLQNECPINRELAVRSFIPLHKQGGTVSYETIHQHAPACLALYHSSELRHWVSDLVGEPLQPTADHDQSSCSLLYYDHSGDHLGWHYDHNFYQGRHFTILLSLVNRSLAGGLSSGRLQRRCRGEVYDVATPENSLVVFEGSRVFHRATAVGEGEERIMLSMTMSTDPRVGFFRELVRRVKDTAYYGPRILID